MTIAEFIRKHNASMRFTGTRSRECTFLLTHEASADIEAIPGMIWESFISDNPEHADYGKRCGLFNWYPATPAEFRVFESPAIV